MTEDVVDGYFKLFRAEGNAYMGRTELVGKMSQAGEINGHGGRRANGGYG